ncbi:ropporin-1-like protein [Myxocyprinus asiaticus]|uniref:ropporin-1-like protein n=1 Tax=Myxocyprinus asiaticus TaxID=70543 RepID=UPI00222204A5|nr:ropporin-1-like protein [Myxocyprinus asiaticus]XP_051538854.1 ropporin-1-like protein [Myxocyprinus asiaticus]XP_051538855.1 ropporin-1-like protein [Myxocyprinus asiaticus]
MPPPETMYCAQQINIPPELPDILKQFTKAAIRTQPQDVLEWATDYFSALSKGEALPVKERMEMPMATQKTDTGLTPGLLKILHQQLAHKEIITKEELLQKWKGLCLPFEQLDTILALGNFYENIDWMQFFALGCSALGGTIKSALKHACEILTEDHEGGAAQIPFDTFRSLYTYLAHLDGEIPKEQTDSFLLSLQEIAEHHGGMVQPSHFTGLCSM